MLEKFWTKAPLTGGIDYTLLLPLLGHAFTIQLLTVLIRVTTAYRILELDLPVVWLGVVSGTFALLPVFLAVWVGRLIDRGHDARIAWIGSALMFGPTICFYLWPGTQYHLLAYTAVLGIGHLFIMASHQMLTVRAGGERGRDSAFGNFSVAQAIGQGVGPMIVGVIGGSAHLPPTHELYGYAVIGMAINFLIGFAIRPIPLASRPAKQTSRMPVRDLLKTPGLTTILLASIITITSSDLLSAYLPLLGTERQISVASIGIILSVRSLASIFSRFGFAAMIRIVGRRRLTVVTMVLAGLGFLGLASPLPLPGLYVASAIMGVGLGISSTLSVSSIAEIVTPASRGTAMTLRITGNRIGQVLVPIAASFIAAAAGAAGVLAIISATLIGSAWAVQRTQRREGQD